LSSFCEIPLESGAAGLATERTSEKAWDCKDQSAVRTIIIAAAAVVVVAAIAGVAIYDDRVKPFQATSSRWTGRPSG